MRSYAYDPQSGNKVDPFGDVLAISPTM